MNETFETAKRYYYFALRDVLLSAGEQYYSADDVEKWLLQKFAPNEPIHSKLINHDYFFSICMHDFVKRDWVDFITDKYAPLFVKKNEVLTNAPNQDAGFGALCNKYDALGPAGESWIRSALSSVSGSYSNDELRERASEINLDGISSAKDSREGSPSKDVWEPIPIDHADQNLGAATEALEKTISGLRGDNGYAATYPEEKSYVQDKLVAVYKRLKEDTQISWMYLKSFAIEPLTILVKRYGGAAIGIAAAAARDAIKNWLKSKGMTILDDIFK